MGLVQRLDTIKVSKGRISDENFQRLKKEGEYFGEHRMIQMKKMYNRLQDVVNSSLVPILEDGDIDSEIDLDNYDQN
jgi:hypothetical protein